MFPDMALALCFFAFQWVWNAKINHDLNTDHPTQVNDLSIMPRSMLDYVESEFSFPVTLTILSVLLKNFIALNVQFWIVFTLGL